MISRLAGKGTWILILLVFLASVSVDAKNSRWREMRNKTLITFDWNCSQVRSFPEKTLGRIVRDAIPVDDRGLPGAWGDRAFKVKAIKGGTVCFVPVVCGATGNCSWRLYTTHPVKYMGTVHGQYIFTYQSSQGWPTIITYGHLSASEGILSTYVVRKGRYKWLGDQYPIDHQRLSGSRMPAFLVKARRMCKDYGG